MNEDFVSFEEAKKLKEKGFDWKTFGFYTEYVKLIQFPLTYTSKNWNKQCDCYSAPTISQVLKWLREEKKIHFESVAAAYGYNVIISQTPDKGGTDLYYTHMNNDGPNDGGAWDEYEDAVIYCIEYTLDNLI